MKLFYFRPCGGSGAFGPVRAVNEREARKLIRQSTCFRRFRGDVWETTQESIDYIANENRKTAAQLQAAGHGICSTDL